MLISLSESGRSAFGRQESAALLELTLERQAADGTWSRPSHWMPSYLWVGLNRHLDGPASDPLRLVKAGRALLLAEGAEASESRSVLALQRVLNDVLPRKRRYCVYGTSTAVEVRVPAFVSEDGFFTKGPLSPERPFDIGTGLERLTREFRRTRLTSGGDFECVDGGRRGIYEPLGATVNNNPDSNPWLYQVHSDVRRWLAGQYGVDPASVDGVVADRWLLVGDEELLFPYGTPFTPADARSALDGLLELSWNVVGRMVQWTLAEGERAAGVGEAQQTSERGFSADGARPTDAWFARTGQGPANCTGMPGYCDAAKPHGPGMSYAYGVRQNVEMFNATVAACKAPDTATIKASTYQGNLDGACNPGGDRRWAGLLSDEWAQRNTFGQFSPTYWLGVDCSGLIAVTLNRAAGEAGAGAAQLRPERFVGQSASYMAESSARRYRVNLDANTRVALSKRMRPGDLIYYWSKSLGRVGHVAYFHSGPVDPATGLPAPGFEDRPDCSSGTCRYRVLHASGDNQACYSVPGQTTPRCSFNRKVVVNEVNALLQSATLRNSLSG